MSRPSDRAEGRAGTGRTDTAARRLFDLSAGERTVPGIWHENYWFRRHEVAYDWVADHVVRPAAAAAPRRPVVLDAGCGEGFGAAMLEAAGAAVVGLDYAAAATAHAGATYPRLALLQGNLVALPLAARSVDVLVSLQTIEHVWDQPRFVAECARLLVPGGLLVVSTPNRHTFPTGNIHHHRELDAAELACLLEASFDAVRVAGVHHGPRLAEWEARHTDLVDGQLAAPPRQWDPTLRAMVRSVRAADFAVTAEARGSLDLLATAVAR